MRIIHVLSVLVIAVIFAACASTNEPTGVWVNKEKAQGKKFHNIFIVVMTADIEARTTVEKDLATAATNRGFKAVRSTDVLKFSFDDPKVPSREEVVSKVKASGCDAVLVATLLKKDDSLRYNPESTVYSQMPYYTHTGNYYGYYSNYYTTVSNNAYYTQDKSYFMQSNLYDVASEEIMWSAQSKVFNPTSLAVFSRTYTTTLMKQLEKELSLKKKQ